MTTVIHAHHNILTNVHVKMMMSVHEWNIKAKLCVVFGPKDVAKYQFICRGPFTIGDRTFFADGVTEEQHMAAINDIIRDDEIRCSQRVFSEIFNKEKMMACLSNFFGD
ncbi:unnamed protein product [Brassica oleracea]|uniref:(rape) hypothetical protein n=1 Tax=Brassica napus TaxID=3708 RepID=A0A816UBD6_BRANA|nr:unnamed protein product [Brassica napus]